MEPHALGALSGRTSPWPLAAAPPARGQGRLCSGLAHVRTLSFYFHQEFAILIAGRGAHQSRRLGSAIDRFSCSQTGLTTPQIASTAFTVGTVAVLPFYTLMIAAPNADIVSTPLLP
jgi:hypothetical protein